ncbi:hypothetical protein J2X54_002631 [Duganella sp. 3397]|uniref:hypothetical protein n=1 Tax=Duganella sp. 3397 TaxID=2817732 RepID=UPI00285C5853|nr:hypothetical protein [Duganella sp. 3397]MDR7050150.1 hypothetical protein [Duganella sp. 3397]
MRKILLALTLTLVNAYAYAYDGSANGKIVRMESAGGANAGANFDIRVTLAPGVAACGAGTVDWVYLNTTDYNYKAMLATLMMAQSMDKTVTIYSTKVAGQYCNIGWIHIT